MLCADPNIRATHTNMMSSLVQVVRGMAVPTLSLPSVVPHTLSECETTGCMITWLVTSTTADILMFLISSFSMYYVHVDVGGLDEITVWNRSKVQVIAGRTGAGAT